MKESIFKKTKEFWQNRSETSITDEVARTIYENMKGFFRVLTEWETKEDRINMYFHLDIPYFSIILFIGQVPIPKAQDFLITRIGIKNDK